jgi:hypothetical protein
LAVGHTTLATPTGLLGSFDFSILGVDLVKVFATRVCCPLLRHIAINCNESKHRWLGHSVDPWLKNVE